MEKLTTIPEFVLFNIVQGALNFIRKDYEDQADKDKSFLRQVLFGNSIERYDLVTQAEQVFINNAVDNPRFLEVNLMFNMQREGLPTIHLTLPSEQPQTGGNGTGSDEGYHDNLIEDSAFDENNVLIKQGSITPVFTRRYQSTYNIVITSDNSNEVVMIYHTMKALLTALTPSISLAGLENLALGGQDIQLYDTLVPKNIYLRALSASVQYETSVPHIFKQPMLHNLTAAGTPVAK